MPIYEFFCEKCGMVAERLKKFEELEKTEERCDSCGEKMVRRISACAVVSRGEQMWEKLKKRSIEQGKKFFRRHERLQELSKAYVERRY